MVFRHSNNYKGNKPKGNGWKVLSTIQNTSGSDWTVFININEGGETWQGIKVCANGVVAFKANYPLTWNGERFSRGRHMQSMKEFRPELEKALVGVMRKYL